MGNGKKIYFISDVHLGAPALNDNRQREKLFVSWLEMVKKDAEEIYLLGDIFDFWYEYRKVVPRGFTRSLGKIAEIADSGIKIHLFTGNHDLWMFDYLPKETGVILHRDPFRTTLYGKSFFIAHGDGLDKDDKGYLLLKKIFKNKILQWMFSRLHPNFAFWLGHAWSKKSRLSKGIAGVGFKGVENEGIVKYAEEVLKNETIDFFVMGHRHIALDIKLSPSSRFILTGDWIRLFTYAEFDGDKFELKTYNISEAPEKAIE
ncbi:MAG: UDP-2,3-diacylglucosamine diphosphatase [Bacteroidota bacterium]|nr:UDP-2,3-diacylglucosamine diphosphatase [Bacteroidota bacterium]MDP4204604.1 UDP-2,3-diacylglucosamine diphosphatase [Bacteroidota bacterium]